MYNMAGSCVHLFSKKLKMLDGRVNIRGGLRTAQRRRDASDAGFCYYAPHRTQDSEQIAPTPEYERMKEKERAAIAQQPTRRKSQKRVG